MPPDSDPIPHVLDDLRAGRMVILLDDEGRENEGDLVVAAQHATPETVNFMLREGRGMLFVALDGPTCDRLDLPPMAAVNTTQRATAYTLTVDASARHGVTTGVSAHDRSATIRRLADPHATPADFDRPGHVQPLRARPGGTLVRAGHTEGAVDLCAMAGLHPAACGIEIMNADGNMARRGDIDALARQHNLRVCTVADVVGHRLQREKLVERSDEGQITTPEGTFRLIAYRSRVDPFPHVALITGDVGRWDAFGEPIDLDDPVLVRMHSQNLLGDVFADTSQPSAPTLHASLRAIRDAAPHPGGALIYLRHEGMGTGLVQRLQTRTHADGTDEINPPLTPHHARDGGAYGIGAQILRDLGIRRLRLLTDHPFTPTALSGFGLEIEEFLPITAAAAGRSTG